VLANLEGHALHQGKHIEQQSLPFRSPTLIRPSGGADDARRHGSA
jgi:hypothetical protein